MNSKIRQRRIFEIFQGHSTQVTRTGAGARVLNGLKEFKYIKEKPKSTDQLFEIVGKLYKTLNSRASVLQILQLE